MNTQITLDPLNHLELNGMADAYHAVLSLPVQKQPFILQFIIRLSEAKIQHRQQIKKQNYLRQSKLWYNALLKQVHCNAVRNLAQENLLATMCINNN